MALKGKYVFGQSEGYSRDADKRAFQRLVVEMKNLIPIEGDPFIIDQEEARPVFEIRAPKGVKDWRMDLMAEDDWG
jgi:hypothetical protein